MMKLSSLRTLAALGAGALLLAACGGGGGGGSAPVVDPIGTSAQFAQIAGDANSCSIDRQKRFVRAYLNEVYLWYREVPNVDPAPYTSVTQIDDYFDALLVKAKDRFVFDGQPFSRAIFTNKHVTTQQASPGSQVNPTSLLASHAVQRPVGITATASGTRVGYVQLANFAEGAQDEVITAFRSLQDQGGVDELVLDLRENTGGFVFFALTTASMIVGPAKDTQTFERLVFNDKVGEFSIPFSGFVQDDDQSTAATHRKGAQLPRLNLSRVFVLTGRNPLVPEINTCSASESVINGLRGVGVQVVRIGDTTCGKPYGFSEKVNCGWSFFAVEFQGFNAAGVGDYQSGIEPMCRMTTWVDPLLRGTISDPLHNAALDYVATGNCPTGTEVAGVQNSALPFGNPASSAQPSPNFVGARLLPPGLMPR